MTSLLLVICKNCFRFLQILSFCLLRRQELYLARELEQPAVEIRAERHLRIRIKSLVSCDLGLNMNIKPVDDVSHKIILAFQLDPHRLAVKHLENLAGIAFERESFLSLLGFLCKKLHSADPIRPERRDVIVFLRLSHDVVEVFVPEKRIRTQCIDFAVMPQIFLLVRSVVDVLKCDFALGRNCIVNSVDNVKQVLILRFNTICCINVTLQVLLLMLTRKRNDFLRQKLTLILSDESG